MQRGDLTSGAQGPAARTAVLRGGDVGFLLTGPNADVIQMLCVGYQTVCPTSIQIKTA